MHKETKATQISGETKRIVWQRDGCRCVLCGSIAAAPHCHFIRRSQGGLGCEENIWTGCDKCHAEFDSEATDGVLHKTVENHLKSWYKNWDKASLVYKKYDWSK